jgi:hypothetical protein
LQRFHIPKLMEYVTHGDRAGVEAYVDSVSSPSKFSIFWDFEQGSVMRLAGSRRSSFDHLVGEREQIVLDAKVAALAERATGVTA